MKYKCNTCQKFKYKVFVRIIINHPTQNNRTLYHDLNGSRWKGSKCPDCDKKYKVKVMRKRRRAEKLKENSELGPGPEPKQNTCKWCKSIKTKRSQYCIVHTRQVKLAESINEDFLYFT